MPKPISQNDDDIPPRRRNVWLILYMLIPLLIVAIDFTMLGIDFILMAIRRYSDIPFVQVSYVITTFVSAVFLLVGIVGTLRWKRWGMFGLIGGLVLFSFLMIIDFFLFGSQAFFDVSNILLHTSTAFRSLPINGEIIAFVIFLIIAGVPLSFILRDKWALFE